MEILKTILTALLSVTTLFILSKLMGSREMSQLTMFDYINSITIGSIAAELATCEFTDITKPFTAMVVYSIAILILEILTNKSIWVRRIITGKSIILYNHGTLYRRNLSKVRYDVDELLSQCRINGYFDLSKIQTIVLEANGQLSILPLADERPVTGKDLNIKPEQDRLVANVIIDGKIMYKNLKHTGNNETWLMNQLKGHGVSSPSEVFLATCDTNSKLCVYRRTDEKMNIDIFE
ncbi:MAG TPA: DUF421 domain-containing protein [Lachnospiraceae bacterium]|nr:DUF421 domain-containing protein [Lachnospiraceae bacterium]